MPDERLEIIANTLEADISELSTEKQLGDLPEWDSFGTVKFIVMLEKKYHRKIEETEIDALKTVGDLLNLMK